MDELRSRRDKPSGPLVIFYTDDLTATQKRMEAAGAKIVKTALNLLAVVIFISRIRMDMNWLCGRRA
jgi:predicted enzyme related to lactoylglutathione lyase